MSISLSEAIVQSLAVAEAEEVDGYCTGDHECNECPTCYDCEEPECYCQCDEEEETEQVIVCRQCGDEDPPVYEMGQANYIASGSLRAGGWGLTFDTWDYDYESHELDRYETECCGNEGDSLEDIVEIRDLPVDR